jgi:hypothetical protein
MFLSVLLGAPRQNSERILVAGPSSGLDTD